jgi:hypothetical protein
MIAQLDADYIRIRPFKVLSRLTSHVLFQGRPLTTRARWINPFLFAQFALVKLLPQLKKVEKPIFILGTGRSGTTILGKVLSLHPHVGFLNEPKALWHAVFPEEDLIGSYSRGLAHYRLGAEDVTPSVRRAAHRLYGYCLALTRSRRILDKYPEMIFRVPFVLAIFPDAKLIFLTRNGWDTAHSIAAWSRCEGEQVGEETHDWWGANRRKWHFLVEQVVGTDPTFSEARAKIAELSRQADMATVEWIATMREGLRLMQSGPKLLHQIYYEELTAHPEHTLKKLLTFCELPEDTALLSYAQRVLVPVPPKQPFAMPPTIEALFFETMQALNYPVGGEAGR